MKGETEGWSTQTKEIKNKQQISPYRHLTKSRPKPLLFALCEICSPCPANRDGTLFFQQNKPEQIDTDRVKRKPTEETARPISSHYVPERATLHTRDISLGVGDPDSQA